MRAALRVIVTAAFVLFIVSGAMAQGLGKGTVRLATVFPSGSGPDVVARIIAEKMQANLGQPVIVEPRPGGAGVVGINAIKNAPQTGNDLVVVDVGQLSINPLIFKKLAYDPDKDLTPVGVLYKTAFFVVVAADSPYRTFKDLMSAATDKSKALKYGSNAVGGPIHLASARLEHALGGGEMLHVPFKETSQLYASVANGDVDWAFGSLATAGPLLRGGKLRFLAVADRSRSPALPDVPTLAEAGGPVELYADTWVAVMAPKGTPAPIVAELNKAINDALVQPDVKEKLAGFGFVPSPGSVQQLVDLTQGDRARYAEVVKRVNVSID